MNKTLALYLLFLVMANLVIGLLWKLVTGGPMDTAGAIFTGGLIGVIGWLIYYWKE